MSLQPQRVTKTTEPKHTPPPPSPALQPQPQEHPLLQLQQDIGNQAVLQLMRAGVLQAKLAVSQPGDAHEQEAERVAQQVMRMPVPQLVENKKTEKLVQTKAISPGSTQVAPVVQGQLNSMRGGGQPLAESSRNFFEPCLGHDFSQVRVHNDTRAAEAAHAVNARAFTHGQDVVFGAGQYAPETGEGRHLLAHELTHVVQQNSAPSGAVAGMPLAASVLSRAAGDAKPAAPAAPNATGENVVPGVVELKGNPEFTPSDAIAGAMPEGKKAAVNVSFGQMAGGPIEVTKTKKGKYVAKRQCVPLAHPLFASIGATLPDLKPCLIVRIDESKVKGFIGLAAGAKIPGDDDALAAHLKKAPDILGLMGVRLDSLPKIINNIDGGQLHLGMKGVKINLGGAFSGTFNLEVIDEAVTFDGSAEVIVKGLAKGTLQLTRSPEGLITGKATVELIKDFKNFTGSAEVAWDGQAVTGQAKVGYAGEKLSGEITLILMEKGQAEQLEREKKAPPEEAKPAAKAVAPTPKKKPSKVDYAVFGEGDLTFAFNEWLNGTAHVIVDSKGFVTIIGKITPQKEFIFLEQKDYVKPIFKLEARASYGVPVVGNIFIFANVGMDAFAKLGPGKFYNIVVAGTYSTDPDKNKDFSIQGSINVSAAAGLRLRAEAGAGLEILGHDIKAGAGINGIAGIRGYAEATPVIGYREKGNPGEDKKGEFYISGDLEIAAQPFLGLSGDLFVELDSPWWSPAPDKKWTWPLFNKEWPIGGSLGVKASVDYVFGSKQWPSIEFKPVEFSAEKFMTDLYDDKTQAKSGEGGDQKGKWAEKNSAAAEPPTGAGGKGNATPGKPAALPTAQPTVKPGAKGTKKPADPNARTAEGKSVKELQEEATKKGKKPEGKDVAKGAGKDEAAKKDKTQETHDNELKQGLAALDAVTARYAKDGATKEEVVTGVKSVRRKFKVFKSIEVIDGGETWDYHYVAEPGEQKGPKKKKDGDKGVKDLAVGDQIQIKSGGRWLLAEITNIVPDSHIDYREEKGKGKLSFESFGKAWRRYVPEAGYKTGEAWEAIKNLDNWTNFNDARQVLNYRHHNEFKNPAGKQWHHIHEQSAKGPNTVDNIAITDTKNNQDFNTWFGQSQEGTGGQPLREWLKGQKGEVHTEWGLKAIRLHGLSRHKRDLGRGPFWEII